MLKTIELPVSIKNELRLWQVDMRDFPQSYINFHEQLARNELKRLEDIGEIFVSGFPKLENSGWIDGYKRLTVQVWHCKSRSMKRYFWNDDNQEFFVKLKRGSCPARLD